MYMVRDLCFSVCVEFINQRWRSDYRKKGILRNRERGADCIAQLRYTRYLVPGICEPCEAGITSHHKARLFCCRAIYGTDGILCATLRPRALCFPRFERKTECVLLMTNSSKVYNLSCVTVRMYLVPVGTLYVRTEDQLRTE